MLGLKPLFEAPPEPQSWLDYWQQDDFWISAPLWQINAQRVMKRMRSHILFSSQDEVLEIGCGGGYLAQQLAPHVGKICAIDPSMRFVEICRRNCRELENVEVKLLEGDYTDLGRFGHFSFFSIHSVVQYYRSVQEIESMIRSAAKVAKPNAAMLISDLIPKQNRLQKWLSHAASYSTAMREGYALPLIKTLYRMKSHRESYRFFDRKFGVLGIIPEQLQQRILQLGFQAELIPESFGILAGRPSLLIYF